MTAAYPTVIPGNPDSAGMESARLLALGKISGAIDAAESAVAAFPDDVDLRLLLAEAADAAHRNELVEQSLTAALALCNRALALAPLDWASHRRKARIEYRLGRFDASCKSWSRVLARNPADAAARLGLAKAALPAGQWHLVSNIEPESVAALVESGDATVSNLLVLPIAGTAPALHKAAITASRRTAASIRTLERAPRIIRSAGPLRIGYVSPDFNDHAVAHQVAGLLEQHDRSRVQVHGYCIGHDDGSPIRARTRAACDRFTEAASHSHDELAAKIQSDQIDILVDLAGHTLDSRPEVFARRPAPIQVNWLGYPGTTGAAFIDYIVADPVVLPDSLRSFFTEAVVRLPCPYLPVDNRQPVSTDALDRTDARLPAGAVVLCAFHQPYKIDGDLVAAWMKILRDAPRSVLWARAKSDAMQQALTDSAVAAGIDPARIIVENHLFPKAAFIARLGLADLFLDTRWFNGHSSVSDALWAGLPVITCTGDAFQGRVAASLLSHAGLADLVCESMDEYAARAIALANDPSALGAVRARVAAARSNSATFDTRGSADAVERAFAIMAERNRAGLPPADFRVPQKERRA